MSGAWKTLVHLHVGDSLVGVPIYLRRDVQTPTRRGRPAQFTRAFVSDQQILQRERKQGVAGWLSLSAYLVVRAWWQP